MDEHELQSVMSHSPKPVAIASAANARVESVRIVISATVCRTALDGYPLCRQQLRQLESKPKGKRELVVPCACRGVLVMGKTHNHEPA